MLLICVIDLNEGQKNIENVINKSLEKSMSQKFALDHNACEKLLSFKVPQIDKSMDDAMNSDVSIMELRKAIKQLNSLARIGWNSVNCV